MSQIGLSEAVPPAAGHARTKTSSAASLNWPLHIVFIAIAVAFVALYSPTFASLAWAWAHTGTYEYAFFIFPICAVLTWLRRERLRRVVGTPRALGLLFILGLCLLWLAGALADINLLQHISVVALIPALVYTIYGPRVAGVLVFPLAYLVFAIPFGNFMVSPLQDVTAKLSATALQLTDIPVYVTGRVIQTPASVWHVAEACSGVKFFIATTAFGVLYANLFFQRWQRRLIFVVCAMVVPIVANGLRVFFTILIGEYAGVQYATGTDHLIFGWQFFGTVLVLLFFAGWPWHEPEPPVGAAAIGASGGRVRSAVGIATIAGLAVVILAIAPIRVFRIQTAPAAPQATRDVSLPRTLGALTRGGSPTATAGLGTVFAKADHRESATYGPPGHAVYLDWAQYDVGSDVQGELVTYGNRLFDAGRWQVSAHGTAPQGGRDRAFARLALRASEGSATARLWYVYSVNGRLTTRQLAVKAWQAWYALLGVPARTSVIVLAARQTDGTDARQRLEKAAPVALAFLAQAQASLR